MDDYRKWVNEKNRYWLKQSEFNSPLREPLYNNVKIDGDLILSV